MLELCYMLENYLRLIMIVFELVMGLGYGMGLLVVHPKLRVLVFMILSSSI